MIVPDATGIRNFILGPFLKQWDGGLLILHEYPKRVVQSRCNGVGERAAFEPLLNFTERPIPFGLRQALAYAQMYWADTGAMRYNRDRPIGGSWRAKTATRAAKLLGKLAGSASGIRLLEKAYFAKVRQYPEVRHYIELFRKARPDLIFSSSQRSLYALAPVLAAKTLGIPTATFIVSWDNLSSKGRIAAPFDHYLVWSEHMREELLQFHPDVDRARVHVVGTPQFEFYTDPKLLLPRGDFFRSVGADPGRPLICYSGGDESIAPQDHDHVRIVMEILRSRFNSWPQMLLRPCPVDSGERFAAVRRDFPEMLVCQPRWERLRANDWSQVVPCADDVTFLANLTAHSDLNINMASTMSLDFGIHDKPVVNIAFDVGDPGPYRLPLHEYYQWEHYQPVVKLGAVRLARSPEELADQIKAYLDNPSLDREGRTRLVAMQIGAGLNQSSERIRTALRQIVQ